MQNKLAQDFKNMSSSLQEAKDEIDLLKQQVEALRIMANSQQNVIQEQQILLKELTYKYLGYKNE